MFAKIRWVCKVQSLGKHKNGWVKKKYSLGSGETKFPLGRGKKSTGSGSTGSVTEGCTLRQLLTNVKDKDEPSDRRGAVYKIKCCDCQATYIGETGRNLNVRLTENKRATRNGDINNHIAEHHLKTNHRIDWDSAECVTYSTDYYQRITLESWFTNLEQTPLNRCQQLPAPYKRLIADNTKTDKQ